MATPERDRMAETGNDGTVTPLPLGRPSLVADRREPEDAARSRWLPDPEQVWLAARLLSALIFVIWFIAWPIGTTLALRETTGVWNLSFGYSGAVVILALSNALLVFAGGYLLRSSLRLEASANQLGKAVRKFEPSLRADAVRTDINLLGGELDKALVKLAQAEKQIREQVGAIDAAAETLRSGTAQGTDRLARERQALIEATAAMNAEADRFAQALASRSSSDEAAAGVTDIEDKLRRLEAISKVSAEQFASFREAMIESTELLRGGPQGLASELKGGAQSLREAQRALMEESEKLRALIEQQKERADSLGRSLAEQSSKLDKRPSTKNIGGSWRRILDKVESQVAQGPAVTGAASPAASPKPADTPASPAEAARLARMHAFTRRLKTQLFGAPTASEIQRYESGEKQLFLHQLLDKDPIELRARLRAANDSDDSFAAAAEAYLNDFDELLTPIMRQDTAASEAALQDMLRTPFGRLYVAIGTAKGHFV